MTGRILGTTTPLPTVEALFRHRDLVLLAARRVDLNMVPFERWERLKIHGVSPPYYMEKGGGGIKRLGGELEVENEGARVPPAARWLGGVESRICLNEGRLGRSSMVLAVSGEMGAARLCRQGARLAGLRHEAEPFEEVQPDTSCNRCCAWGHIAPQCPVAAPRCDLFGEGHQTADHQRPVERGSVKRGRACAHVVAKRMNCAGPHLSQANVWPVKGGGHRLAKGWRSPSSPRRERRAPAPPEGETPGGPVTGVSEMEVGRQPGVEAEGGGRWRSRALGRVWMDFPSFVWRNWDEGDQGVEPYVVFWDGIWLFWKSPPPVSSQRRGRCHGLSGRM